MSGLARYRVTIEPWLAEARYRRDCRLYQDKTALEVVEAVLPPSRQIRLRPPWRRRAQGHS